MIIDNLITLCIERDLEIWKHNAPQIVENIQVKNYILVVPDMQVRIFKLHTPSIFQIVSESDVNPNVTKIALQNSLPDKLKMYSGWYLQQIIKIEALINSIGSTTVIWDSDTIPLKPLNFINPNGSLNYYVGEEFNPEYFLTNERLISIGKNVTFSFIAQCFPAYISEIKALIALIESTHGNVWYEAMLQKLSGNIIQAFSEYELMGNYLHDKSLYEMNYLHNKKWSRDGKRIFKTYDNLNLKFFENLSAEYDFVAIEGGLDKGLFEFYVNKIKNRVLT